MTAPDTTLAPPPVQPDAGMIATFMDAVFGYCEGYVPIRALAEKGGPDRPPHTPFIAADGELGAKTAMQATWAADAGMALYAVPGTVTRPGEARAEDVAQTQVVLVDLDHGDIEAKREHLIRHLGEPCLEVASGGVTAEGQAKLHLYWRLTEPAEGEDIARVCRLRHMIAVKAGGDPAFRSPHQPIRVAGSVYRKNDTPRLVRIIGREERDYDLAEFAEAVVAMPPLEGTAASTSDLDFNDAGTGSIEDIFVQRVREGGADGITRFEAISKVIGYWIRRARDGHVTPAGAWEEIVAYNEARVDPPWPLDRLQAETKQLWKRDRENNGAIAAEGGATTAATTASSSRWASPRTRWRRSSPADTATTGATSPAGDSGSSGAAPTGRRRRRSAPTISPGMSAAMQRGAATMAGSRRSCRPRRRSRRWSVSPAPIAATPPPPRSGTATCGRSTRPAG